MPLMHRISVFRDDVVFVLFMLQRRWYPIDLSRPAEGYELPEDAGAAAMGARDGLSPSGPAAPAVGGGQTSDEGSPPLLKSPPSNLGEAKSRRK